jgi:polyisoprenoid-binding protein YceI
MLTRTASALLLAIGAALAAPPTPALSQSPSTTRVRLDLTDGSKAGYRVNEQLARLQFPNDAVGTTENVTGALVLLSDGTFTSDSKLTVDLRTLKSDEPKRDAFLRENTLQTDKFPLAVFVAKRHQDLKLPLAASGTATFRVIGDMTLHGVTSDVTWAVRANLGPSLVTATATTNFPFAKFKLTIPKIFGHISVVDDIKLELDVRMRRSG